MRHANYRENYSPEEPQGLMYWETADLVLLWLSGFVCGLIPTLIYYGG